LANPPAPPLRADSARNRAKILEAAEELFGRHGADAVALDDVVAAAGVGKGTLFRIFGNKAGLAAALLDERERELQGRVLDGPPPLGPGAEPPAALTAFVDAYVRYVAAHAELVLMSQTSSPGGRFAIGSHRFWRAHLTDLFRRAGTPSPQFAADVLLAATTAEQIIAWRDGEGRDAAWISRHLGALARRIAG
jgi:AcrR family transcriptional regulator